MDENKNVVLYCIQCITLEFNKITVNTKKTVIKIYILLCQTYVKSYNNSVIFIVKHLSAHSLKSLQGRRAVKLKISFTF